MDQVAVGRPTAFSVTPSGLNATNLGEGAVVDLGDGPLGSVAQTLHSGGHNGVGLAGLVDVDADDLAVLSGSGSSDGLEHGAAAGKDDLSAVGVPAGDHGLQLGEAWKEAPYSQE